VATHRIPAPDGRTLTVDEGGDPRGAPVVVHHGTPGARLLYGPHVEDARREGIRLIGYDRPGYGGSTPHPGRSIADAAADVEAICDALGLERIATWGGSGGGPHALACAALLPDRVAAAASVAGVAPYDAEDLDWLAGMGEQNIEEFGAVLEGREMLAPLLDREAESMVAGRPEELLEALHTLLSPPDRAVLSGELAEFMLEQVREGIAERRDGWVDDDLAFAKPWGFDPGEIRVPTQVWQGAQDRFVPYSHGEWLVAHVPGTEPKLSQVDGHLTLVENRLPEIHGWLLSHLA
jgi:pimeloyl-ACP methyl ester carboxylesterase